MPFGTYLLVSETARLLHQVTLFCQELFKFHLVTIVYMYIMNYSLAMVDLIEENMCSKTQSVLFCSEIILKKDLEYKVPPASCET